MSDIREKQPMILGDIVAGKLPHTIDEKIADLKAEKERQEKQNKLDAENDKKFQAAITTAGEKARAELLENFKRAVGKNPPHPLNIPCPACLLRNTPSAMDFCVEHPAGGMAFHGTMSIGCPIVLMRPHATDKTLLQCPICGNVQLVF